MPGFSTTTLKVETSDGRQCVLIEPFTFTAKDGTVITVPAGTTSDGASTPRAIWAELPPFGRYWPAAYLHDSLYRDSSYHKDFCDAVLLEAMESLGVHEIIARVIFEGVALGGQISFDKDRADQAAAVAGAFAPPSPKAG
jgi:hypothetical protein